MIKCYACWKQAVGKKIRKFERSGLIKDTYYCSECASLSDKEFEGKYIYNKNKRKQEKHNAP